MKRTHHQNATNFRLVVCKRRSVFTVRLFGEKVGQSKSLGMFVYKSDSGQIIVHHPASMQMWDVTDNISELNTLLEPYTLELVLDALHP